MKGKILESSCGNIHDVVPVGTIVNIVDGMAADSADVFNLHLGMCWLCEYKGKCFYWLAKDVELIYDKEIDWEQRRYEIAKETLQTKIKTSPIALTYKEYAERSVGYADALIAELKKGEN